MKRNPNPPRMFCSFFFFPHFLTFTLSHSQTHTEREERREKRGVCAIALIANEGAAIQGGVGWGERKGKEYIHTHAWQWMDALRCAAMGALQWVRCNAMEWKWVGILLLSFLVPSCFFLLFKERACLIGAAAAAIAGCWLSKFTIRMQWN